MTYEGQISFWTDLEISPSFRHEVSNQNPSNAITFFLHEFNFEGTIWIKSAAKELPIISIEEGSNFGRSFAKKKFSRVHNLASHAMGAQIAIVIQNPKSPNEIASI